MGLFRRSQEEDPSFTHGSGHDSLAAVISEQSPKYEGPNDVTRPRGRAYRLHPDEAPEPAPESSSIPPFLPAGAANPSPCALDPEIDADLGAGRVIHLWDATRNRGDEPPRAS